MSNELQTRAISALRFPLSIGIVLLHTIIVGQSYPYGIEIDYGQYPFLDIVVYISQREIGDIAVPLFFFFSGFLFFYKVDFSFDVYRIKLHKRVRSLLLPYFIWNTLWLLFTWSCYITIPSLLASTKDSFDNFTVFSLIDGYVGYCDGPSLAPLWFIRDLMIVNLFAYPLYYLIKHYGGILNTILLSLFLLKIGYETPYIGIRSWAMYTLGAWFAISKRGVLDKMYSNRRRVFFTFLILLVIRTMLYYTQRQLIIVNQMELMAGMFSLLFIAASIIEKRPITFSERLASASFFVYAAHMFVINLPNKLWVCVMPVNAISATVVQWLIPVAVSFFLYYFFKLLRWFFPKFSAMLIGGRC